jgi:hypothetical protein
MGSIEYFDDIFFDTEEVFKQTVRRNAKDINEAVYAATEVFKI